MTSCSHVGCNCKNLYTDWVVGNRSGLCDDCGHDKTMHERPLLSEPLPAAPPSTIAHVANSSVSASKLSVSTALGFLAYPSHSFHYGVDSVMKILDDIREDTPLATVSAIAHTLSTYSQGTYNKRQESEVQFTRPNLMSILDQTLNMIGDNNKSKFLVKAERDFAQFFDFSIASARSSPEVGLVYQNKINKLKCGVITSEVKDVYACNALAIPQGVTLACEVAVDQVNKGIPLEDILVPFVLVFGEYVQFGSVFVLAPSFPVPVLLTSPLSLLLEVECYSVCKWIRALALFCDRQSEVFDALGSAVVHAKPSVDLDTSGLFVKPVETEDVRDVGGAVARILSIFQKLWDHPPCRDFVVFPSGRCGLPGVSTPFRDVMRSRMLETHLKNLPPDHDGWPLLLYPKLRRSKHWRSAESCLSKLSVFRAVVMQDLTDMLGEVERAGVIHLDLRLSNVMVRLPSQKKMAKAAKLREGQVAGSAGLTKEPRPKLRIIDWDSSAPLGSALNPSLVNALSTDPDRRYPVDEERATTTYHQFFLQKIAQDLDAAAAKSAQEDLGALADPSVGDKRTR